MKTSSEPASRMPYDVPLRHIIVTMLEPSTCSAHIAVDFAAAMARFRKNRWFPDRYCADGHPSGVRQRRELRKQVADQQVGRALGPHVHVVADLNALRGQGEEVDRAGRVQDLAQHRPGDVAQELAAWRWPPASHVRTRRSPPVPG